MRCGYYPGCSLENTCAPYDLSTRAVAPVLGLQLEEIEDWNCCGATEVIALNKNMAYAMVARNLALAERQLTTQADAMNGPPTLVAPCSACFLNLSKTDHYMAKHPEVEAHTNQALAAGGLHYTPGSLHVRHMVDVVANDVGLEAVKAKVKRPLRGLRVAPYYGCLIVRPNLPGHTFDDPEYPIHMDRLLTALGAEVVDFPLKAHCCGGHMTQISADTAYKLIYQLLRNAADYNADVIATICPMCQLNLDAYQSQVNKHFKTDYELPVLYFTQLMGVAFDLPPRELGLGREVVSAAKALAKVGVEVPAEEATATKPARRKKDDRTLPMPAARAPAVRKPRMKK